MKNYCTILILLSNFCLYGQFNHLISGDSNSTLIIRDAHLEGETAFLAYNYSDMSIESGGIMKMTDDGQIAWSRKIGGQDIYASYSYNIFKADSNHFIWHGLAYKNDGEHMLFFKFDENGQVVFGRDMALGQFGLYYMNDFRMLYNGDYLFFGSIGNQIIITRMTNTGSLLWSKSITNDPGSSGKNPGFSFTERNDGSIVICGKDENSLVLHCLSGSGNLSWSKFLNVGYYIHPKSILCDAQDNIFVSGEILAFSEDKIGLLKFNPYGELIWSKEVEDYHPGFIHQKLSMNNSKVELSCFGYDINGSTMHYLFQFDQNGSIMAAFQHDVSQAWTDYNVYKTVVDQPVILGGVYSDGWTYPGLILQETPGKFNCYFSEIEAHSVPFSEISDTVSPAYIQNFGSLVNFNVELSDLLVTASIYCEELSVSELNVYNFEIYPNPNVGTFTIRLESSEAKMTISDNTGRTVFFGTVHAGEILQFDQLEPGNYQCMIRNGEHFHRKTLVIQ